MVDVSHRLLTPTNGIHVAHSAELADEAAILALTGLGATDAGRVYRSAATGILYWLRTHSPKTFDRFASYADVVAAVAGKADSSAMTTALAAKADSSAMTTALAAKADLDFAAPGTYSGASNTFSTTNARKVNEVSHTAATSLTIPTGMPLRSLTGFLQTGAGQLTLVQGASTTLTPPGGFTLKSRGQWCTLWVYVRSAGVYIVSGDVAAS